MSLLVLTRARIAQVVILVGAVVAVLAGFGIVHWSNAQAGLVATETSTGLVLVMAVVVHFRPNTPSEPVAVAGSVSAFATSTFALLVGFEVVAWTQAQVGLLLALVAVIVTLAGTWTARSIVTSPETFSASVNAAQASSARGGEGTGVPPV